MVTPERDERAMFKILKTVVNDGVGARLGTLSLPKRNPIDTPNFIGLTARGALPHLTPDNISKWSELGGVYIALEDCKSIPISPLTDFLIDPHISVSDDETDVEDEREVELNQVRQLT